MMSTTYQTCNKDGRVVALDQRGVLQHRTHDHEASDSPYESPKGCEEVADLWRGLLPVSQPAGDGRRQAVQLRRRYIAIEVPVEVKVNVLRLWKLHPG